MSGTHIGFKKIVTPAWRRALDNAVPRFKSTVINTEKRYTVESGDLFVGQG